MKMPDDILLGAPRLLLRGDGYLFVENHHGVIEYGGTRLRMRVRFGEILVEGEGLALSSLGGADLLVTGQIRVVTLTRQSHA